MFGKTIVSLFALAMISSAAPASAQNRFADEAKERAQRREENAAIRAAEHPQAAKTAETSGAPAAPQPAAATPAAPAPGATASNPTPAPAQ